MIKVEVVFAENHINIGKFDCYICNVNGVDVWSVFTDNNFHGDFAVLEDAITYCMEQSK